MSMLDPQTIENLEKLGELFTARLRRVADAAEKLFNKSVEMDLDLPEPEATSLENELHELLALDLAVDELMQQLRMGSRRPFAPETPER